MGHVSAPTLPDLTQLAMTESFFCLLRNGCVGAPSRPFFFFFFLFQLYFLPLTKRGNPCFGRLTFRNVVDSSSSGASQPESHTT